MRAVGFFCTCGRHPREGGLTFVDAVPLEIAVPRPFRPTSQSGECSVRFESQEARDKTAAAPIAMAFSNRYEGC